MRTEAHQIKSKYNRPRRAAIWMWSAIILLTNVPAIFAATIVRVEGNGSENNTEEIQQAFDAAIDAGPGSVVILAGTLFTNEIDATGFKGLVLGDPGNPPVIDVLRGLDPSLPGVGLEDTGNGTAVSRPLFTFRDVFVWIRGPITFNITPAAPAAEHLIPDPVPKSRSSELSHVIRLAGTTRAWVSDVTIIGGAGDHPIEPPIGNRHNVRVGISVTASYGHPFFQAMTGKVAIVDSTFSTMTWAVGVGGQVDGSRIRIVGNHFLDNMVGIVAANNSGSTFQIRGNDIRRSSGSGVTVFQDYEPGVGPPTPVQTPSKWIIDRNTIASEGGFVGIEAVDVANIVSGIVSAEVTIRKNDVSGEGFVPIVTDGVVGSRIINNYVTGSWVFGINPFEGSNDCVVSGNRLGVTRNGQALGIETQAGAVSVEIVDNCSVEGNEFVKVTGPAVLVLPDSRFNRLKNNNYRASGLTECAIILQGNNNLVVEHRFPEGTVPEEQVCDFGNDNVVRVH